MVCFEITLWFASNTIYAPILMLWAQSQEGDRVKGLDLGANDYVSKPFFSSDQVSGFQMEHLSRAALQCPAQPSPAGGRHRC
jgi:DNA-binding response OmpR family regulator